MSDNMNDKDIETLSELIATKVCEKYVLIMKDHVATRIQLHKAECSAGKFSKVMGVVCAVVGSACVAVINWLLRK